MESTQPSNNLCAMRNQDTHASTTTPPPAASGDEGPPLPARDAARMGVEDRRRPPPIPSKVSPPYEPPLRPMSPTARILRSPLPPTEAPEDVFALCEGLSAESTRIPSLHLNYVEREKVLPCVLDEIYSENEGTRTLVVAIQGGQGLGKTAFALSLAERLSGTFPDCRMFVDMGAHGPVPVSVETAKAALLMGCQPKLRIPEDTEELRIMYQSTLSRQHTFLLVLDDVTSREQLQDLLPRRHDLGQDSKLTDLIEAQRLSLDKGTERTGKKGGTQQPKQQRSPPLSGTMPSPTLRYTSMTANPPLCSISPHETPSGAVIVTSREGINVDNLSPEVHPIVVRLDALPEAQAKAVLYSWCPRLQGYEQGEATGSQLSPRSDTTEGSSSPTTSTLRRKYSYPTTERERTLVSRLVVKCGHVPLALRIVGALLSRLSNANPEDVYQALADNEERNWDSIRSALLVSYSYLSNEEKQLLTAVAAFPHDFDLDAAAVVMLGHGVGHGQLDQVFNLLTGLVDSGLVLVNNYSQRYRLHDVVRSLVWEDPSYPLATASATNMYIRRYIRYYHDIVSECSTKPTVGVEIIEALRFNIEAAVLLATNKIHDGEGELIRSFCLKGAELFSGRLGPHTLRVMYEKGLHSAMQSKEEDISFFLAHLGMLYSQQGVFGRAEPLIKEALINKILSCFRHAMPENRELVTLVRLFYTQHASFHSETMLREGMYIKCLKFAQHADRLERPDRLSIGQLLSSLADCFSRQNKWEDAEAQYIHALAILRMLPEEKRALGSALAGLGQLYFQQEKFSQAEPLFAEALAIGREVYGEGHVELCTQLNNLAEVHRYEGKFSEAEAMYREAYGIGRDTLGVDHPEVTAILNNLACLYESAGVLDKAEKLLTEVIEIYRRNETLHYKHTDLAGSLNNLAMLYQQEGRHTVASHMMREALELAAQQYGSSHPTTMNIAENYGTISSLSNEDETAFSLGPFAHEAMSELHRREERAHSGTSSPLRSRSSSPHRLATMAHTYNSPPLESSAPSTPSATLFVTYSRRRRCALQ